MSFYSELADTANEMIEEFGQSIIVTSYEMGVEDTSTGVVSQVPTTFTTTGVLLDYDYRNFGEGEVPYHATSASDKRLIANATNVIKPGDQIIVDNAVYKAHIVKAVNPAGTRVLYDIWMQR